MIKQVIEKNAVIMMGAVINIGAVVGEETMIDMGDDFQAPGLLSVKNAHIPELGAVLAGVLEPPSASPVIIEDHVLIGANAVVLEGVRVGEGCCGCCWICSHRRCTGRGCSCWFPG